MKTFYSFFSTGGIPIQHHLLERIADQSTLKSIEWQNIEEYAGDTFPEGSVFVFNYNDIPELGEKSDITLSKIRECKNKKVIIIHIGFNLNITVQWNKLNLINAIQLLEVNSENLYIFVPVKLDKLFVDEQFPGCHCFAYDEWAHEYRSYVIDKNNKIHDHTIEEKRFGLFVRRYEKERLNFFLSLLNRKLLKYFHYTFTNLISPHIPKYADYEQLEKDIDTVNLTNRAKTWIKSIPYTVGELHSHTDSAYPLRLENYIQRSQFIIVQETGAAYLAPTSITEKTFKAIYHKKPFIILGHHKILNILRDDGFETFSPYINEDYDLHSSYSDRVDTIIKEVERFSQMNEDQFNDFLKNIEPIIRHNYDRLIKKFNETPPEKFHLMKIYEKGRH